MEKLSKREYEIMGFFWEEGRPLCVSDIEKLLERQQLAYVTIASFIQKLYKKGALQISHKEGAFVFYEPKISKVEYEQFMIEYSLNKNYGKSFFELVANFCGKKGLSKEQEERLESLLKEFEEGEKKNE